MKIKRAIQNLYVIMAVLCMLCTATAWSTTPAAWKDTGFSINSEGMHLREVLNEFALAYGVKVSFSLGENSILRGKIKSESGVEFLNRLANSHEFRWFVYNDTLYVVPKSDYTSLRLHVV
jgi:type III secretion protein C